MKRKSVSEILEDVAPNLKVIPRGARRRRNRENAVKLNGVSHIELPAYIPHRMTQDDWNDAGGVKCPRCNNNCVQLVPIGLTGKIKMCPDCIQRRRRLLEYKRRLTDIRHGNTRSRASSFNATF